MASAKAILIPLGVLAGIGVAVGVAVWKTKKASASPLLEEAPKPGAAPPPEEQGPSESSLVAEYAKAMGAGVKDLDYLQGVADMLDANGRGDWAAQVRTKMSSIQAGQGAAMAAAQAEVAKQAAVTPAELAPGMAQWEATAGKPTQADVDKMFNWAMGDEVTDTAMVQTAYQLVIAYDQSPAKPTRMSLLGDKLAKLMAGTYKAPPAPVEEEAEAPEEEEEAPMPAEPAPAPPKPKIKVTAPSPAKKAPAPHEVVVKPPAAPEVKLPAPTPGQVAATPEPVPGVTTLPPLPPEPSPLPPAQQPQTPATAAVPELAKEETAEHNDPNGTIAVARALIAVEAEPDWKGKLQGLVTNWQRKVGLTADGLFGTSAVERMAQEVGVLPLVRYFSKKFATKAAALKDYQARLYAAADAIEPKNAQHAAAIRASIEHEQGQGWPSKPGPVVNAAGQPTRLEMYDRLDKAITAIANQDM
jgi:hypothetical protein